MMRILLLVLLVICSSFSLKEKIIKGNVGDYIVAEQSKNYFLLMIRELSPTTLVLEEITSPEKQTGWAEWFNKGAPGNTSWVVYTIDLKKNKLKESYSFSRKTGVPVENSFFTQLFALPLKKTEDGQRKRIGPPPVSGETDRRGLWNPPLFVLGKKMDKPQFEVFATKWPDDGTELSHCEVSLYFDSKRLLFPFPCWIEVKSPHYFQNIRIVDSGSGLVMNKTS